MKYRPLGRTGWNVSELSLGAWGIGGAWGDVFALGWILMLDSITCASQALVVAPLLRAP